MLNRFASTLLLGIVTALAALPAQAQDPQIIIKPNGNGPTYTIPDTQLSQTLRLCYNLYVTAYKCTQCNSDGTISERLVAADSSHSCQMIRVFPLGSMIDTASFNHIQSVTDLKLGQSSGGCSSCGSSAPSSGISAAAFSRIFRSRDVCSAPSSFGVGVYSSNDVSLSLFTDASGIPVIDVFNPSELGIRRLKLSGSKFIDSTYEASRGILLYTATGAATTSFAQAATCVLTQNDGAQASFEIFLDQDNADPALRSYGTRLVSLRQLDGKGFTLSYADAAASSASPAEKRRYSRLADSQGGSIDFSWTPTLVGSGFAVAAATGSDGQTVTYAYSGNNFASATYGDGSQASLAWSIRSSGLTQAHFVEPRLGALDRDKYALYTSASTALQSHEYTGLGGDGVHHFNSASNLCLAVVKNGETTFVMAQDPVYANNRWIYEGGGRLRKIEAESSREYKSWTFNPNAASLGSAFSGSLDSYAHSQPANPSTAKGRPEQLQMPDGTRTKSFYSADGSLRAVLHADGSYERFLWDANRKMTMHQDRSGRIEKFTYSPEGLKTSHSTGWAQKRVYEVAATAPGLKASLYATDPLSTGMPDFSTLAPYAVERQLDLSLPDVMALDRFAVVFEGDIDVSAAGDYTFFVLADDGAQLFIDNAPVATGPNWATEGSGSLSLSPGKHAIKVTYYETTGAEKLQVKWQGPGIAKQLIPASVFSHTVAQQEVEAVATTEAATESWEYYPAGHPNQFLLKSHTDFKGVKDQILTYDSRNRLIKVEEINDAGDAYIAKQIITHDESGVASVTDANGRTTSFQRDNMGRLICTTYYDGSTEKTFFGNSGNSAGLVVKTKDRSGATTTYAHDANGRTVQTIRGYSIIDANGNEVVQAASAQSVETCTYLDGSTLKKSCLRDGELTEYEYDAELRMISSKTWVSATKALVSTSSYLDGKLFSSTDAYGRRSFSFYRPSDQALVRSVQELVPGGAGNLSSFAQVALLQRDLSLNPAYTITDTELDAAGNTLATIDPKGVRSESVLDSRGRTIRSVQAAALQPFYGSSTYADLDLAASSVTLSGSWV
jgi:YD repeat-containing protein